MGKHMSHTSQVLMYTRCGPGLVQVVLGYSSNACLHHSKKTYLHVGIACIAKLTRRERNPSTLYPCTTAPSTRHSRGSASTVASAGSSRASPPWPTHPGREASPDSPLQHLHLCVCGRARYKKPKVRRIMLYRHRGAIAQYVRFTLVTL